MYKIIYILMIVSVTGCDLFSTRDPEIPDTGKSNYLPPTEPSIVIQNFEYSIKEKNLENYLKCFVNSNSDTKKIYAFYPTPDAVSSFGSLFENWTVENERRVFNSIISQLSEGSYPVLYWQNKQPMNENSDSAIFVADYYLKFDFNDTNLPGEFAGKITLTMIPQDNGLWLIKSWYDYNATKIDSIKNTWSLLKAKLYN
jgi:hypothetical protein